MLKKLTFSNNAETTEVDFTNGLNLIKDPNLYEKFLVLDHISEYNVLKLSTDATGDFIEFENFFEDHSYFLTMYPQSMVYEFYNEQDVDQDLSKFIPQIIRYSNFEYIIEKQLTSKSFEGESNQIPHDSNADKIKDIENSLQKSKEVESISTEISSTKIIIDTTQAKISEFEKINDKLIIVEQKKQDLGIFSKLDFQRFENDLKLLSSEIKTKNEILNSQEKSKHLVYETQTTSVKSPIILGLLLTIDILITIGISFTAPFQAIAIGLGIAIALLIWYFATGEHLSNKDISLAPKHDFKEEIALIERSKNDLIDMIGCSSESEFYEKKAQLQAYDYEISQLKEVIKSRFNDFDFNKAKEQIEQLEMKLGEMVSNQLSTQSFKLSPEEYLKKRRELDILKMDQIRNESSKKIAPVNSKISSEVLDLLGIDLIIEANQIKAQNPQDLFIACVANAISTCSTFFGAIVDDPFIFSTTSGKVSNILQKLSLTVQIIFSSNHNDYDSLGNIVSPKPTNYDNTKSIQDNNTDAFTDNPAI